MLTLELAPPVISVALGVRKDLVERAHAAGSTAQSRVIDSQFGEQNRCQWPPSRYPTSSVIGKICR